VSGGAGSGRLSTPAKLYLRLRSVTVGGKSYTISERVPLVEHWAARANAMPVHRWRRSGRRHHWSAGRRWQGRSDRGSGWSGSGTAGAAATGKKDIEFPAETKLAFTTRRL